MTSSLTHTAIDAFVCPLLKTGQEGCLARFDRSLYHLLLSSKQGEETVDLGFSGSRVLERLLRVPGEVISRDELLSYAWEGRVVGQGSLNQQIYTLRQALFDSRNQIIQTLPRRGYLFNPQFLVAVGEPAPAPTEIAAPAGSVLAELPAPSAETIMSPAKPARRYRSRQATMLAGTGVMLVLALVTLGLRMTGASEQSVTHSHSIGELDVLYIEKNQHRLDSLVKETQLLLDNMDGITAKPARLVVNKSPSFYEIRCLQGDGQVNWLKIHKSQIHTVPTEHLQGCLQ